MWVINLIDNGQRYGLVAMEQALALRERSQYEVSFLVTKRTNLNDIKAAGFKFWMVPPIESHIPSATVPIHDIELTKLRVFQLPLEWACILDADIKVVGDNPDSVIQCHEKGKLGLVSGGPNSPICTCCFTCEPSVSNWNEVVDLLLWPEFSVRTGYRNSGPIWWEGRYIDWKFHGANVSQGVVWYLWKERFYNIDKPFNRHFQHLVGNLIKGKTNRQQRNCPKCQVFAHVNIDDDGQTRKFTCTNCWHVWSKAHVAKGQTEHG